mmetsp:Transcript_32597/g.79089  ORF Transcript_32597/g.79089 Transcript_32597/m.79089 type:complete len:410 (+) Transcript_32597:189-1418(+)
MNDDDVFYLIGLRQCTILMMRIRCWAFLFLILASSAEVTMAQDNTTESNVTSGSPTAYADTLAPSDSPSTAPSTILPTNSISPTINYDEVCPNSLDWKRLGRPWEGITEWQKEYTCDDDKVSCHDFGSLGPAYLHCCKCRPICCGRCNVTCHVEEDNSTNPPIGAPSTSQTSPSTSPGYKYDLKGSTNGSTSDTSSSWNFRPGPRHGSLLIIVFFVSVIFCCNREQRSLRRTRRTMNQRRRQQQNSPSSEDGGEISEERYQLFVSKFHFEIVPPHGSSKVEDKPDNIMVRENSTTSSKMSSIADKEGDEDNDENDESKIRDVESAADVENTLKSVNSSTSTCCSYQPFACLKRIPAKGECAICLDGYHPGDTVCIAVNEACNHVYHRECVVEWLKANGRCPLCRVDLMK